MKLLVVYRPNSEYSRITEEFVHNFTKIHPDTVVDIKDADSIDGVRLSELYDLVQQPAILVLDNEGILVHSWCGPMLPTDQDVFGYINN